MWTGWWGSCCVNHAPTNTYVESITSLSSAAVGTLLFMGSCKPPHPHMVSWGWASLPGPKASWRVLGVVALFTCFPTTWMCIFMSPPDPSFVVHSFTLDEARAPQFNSQKLWSDGRDPGLDSLTPVSDPMKTFYPSRMPCNRCPGVS